MGTGGTKIVGGTTATVGGVISTTGGVVSTGIGGGLLSIGEHLIFHLFFVICLVPETNCVITLPFLVETISVCELDNNPLIFGILLEPELGGLDKL